MNRLPMDLPEQREEKRGDYVLDIVIERGPHVTIRLSKVQADAAFDAITLGMGARSESPIIEFDHDVGRTAINSDTVMMVTVRPYEIEADTIQHTEGAPVIGMVGRKPRMN